MAPIEIHRTKHIARTPDVLRCHFLDMHHHVAVSVHHGVTYRILDEEPQRLRVRQEFRVMGMKKKDELVLYATRDGRVIQEFLAGDFAGGGIELHFHAEGGGTRVEAILTAPLRGINKLLRPLIKRTVEKLVDQALEEDRIDLEERGYQPGKWASSALASARA
jgi:hypothetical protein